MLSKLNRLLEKAVGLVIGLILLCVTLLLCGNVITRYVFGFSLSWGEEVTAFAMIWITFLGSGLCVRKGLHVSMDAFVQLLPQRGQMIFKVFGNLVGLTFSVFMLVIGWNLMLKVGASGQISAAAMIPIKYIYAIIPAGALYMILEYIEALLKVLSKKEQTVDELEHLISGHV
ncbi:hypothetical protein JCM17380_22360 [Desulfosporosinus burensis]